MKYVWMRFVSIFAAALAMAAIFCACSADTPSATPRMTSSPSAVTASPSPSITSSEKTDPSPTPVLSPTPGLSPAPGLSAAPSPTATPFSINPLYSFYKEYSIAADAAIMALREKLDGKGDAEALNISLMTDMHRHALSEIYVSVCRLIENGGSYYADLDGAAAGSGAMSPMLDGYSFEYAYDDGRVLSGKYRENEGVEFGVYGADGLQQTACSITKTAEGWTSTVNELGDETALIFAQDADAAFILNQRKAALMDGKLYINDYAPPVRDEDAVTFASP